MNPHPLKYTSLGLLLFSFQAAAANETAYQESHTNKQLQQIMQQEPPELPVIADDSFSPPVPAASVPAADAFTELERQLNQALENRHYQQIEALLPAYRNAPQADTVLIDFAEGALLRARGKHKQAIARYRAILAKHPDLAAVRLDLAAMLFEDQQLKASQTEFTQARSQGLPEDVLPRIENYQRSIEEADKWSFNLYGSYVSDHNVNNVSAQEDIYLPQFGFPLRKNPQYLPQKARGIEYGAGASKDTNIGGNHYAAVSAQAYGVSYWNNHDYDDLTLNVSAGYRNKHLNGEWSIIPFYEKNRYGRQWHSDRYGADAQYGIWLNTRWHINARLGGARKSYRNSSKHGREWQADSTLSWLAGRHTRLSGGISYNRDITVGEPSDSSKRFGGHISWSQQWPASINSRLSLSRHHQRFDGTHYIFQDKRRLDKKSIFSLTLWHPKASFYGITPKLNLRRTQVSSNIDALHSYRKNKVFISMEKSW